MGKVGSGRWVIIFEDKVPPVLWSTHRETLDAVCRHLRMTCPKARVEWEPNQHHDDGTSRDKYTQ